MNNYVQQLHLDFDPFEPNASKNEFYSGGNRQEICNQIVERAMYSDSLISVCGCLGSGKSMLASAISNSFADEAISALVVATLFMNPDQFLESLVSQLDLSVTGESKEDTLRAISQLANQLDLEAKSLLIQIDDAHELSGEVFQDLMAIKADAPASSIHIILLGENQLGNMLENSLDEQELAQLAEFDLLGFGSEATIDYIRFKLELAGYSKAIPLSGSELGKIYNASNGIPGAINALTADALVESCAPTFGSDDSFSISDEGPMPAIKADHEAREEDSSSSVRGYMVAAAALSVVFLGTLFFFNPTDTAQQSTVELPVVSSVSAPAPALNSDLAARPRSSSADTSVLPLVESVELPSAAQAEQVQDEASSIQQLAEIADKTDVEVLVSDGKPPEKTAQDARAISESSLSQSAAPLRPLIQGEGAIAVQSPPPEAAPQRAVVARRENKIPVTAFEQSLLSLPSSHYAVQVIGSSSESNIIDFISKESLGDSAGYFETRLNAKPWFVVVIGGFADRSTAIEVMDDLPDSVRSFGPWVRSLAGVQSDIKSLKSPN